MAAYIISDGEFVKIGHAKNIESRLAALQTSSPKPLVIVAQFEDDDVEKELHLRFRKYRKCGEWFDIEVLKELQSPVTSHIDHIEELKQYRQIRDIWKRILDLRLDFSQDLIPVSEIFAALGTRASRQNGIHTAIIADLMHEYGYSRKIRQYRRETNRQIWCWRKSSMVTPELAP